MPLQTSRHSSATCFYSVGAGNHLLVSDPGERKGGVFEPQAFRSGFAGLQSPWRRKGVGEGEEEGHLPLHPSTAGSETMLMGRDVEVSKSTPASVLAWPKECVSTDLWRWRILRGCAGCKVQAGGGGKWAGRRRGAKPVHEHRQKGQKRNHAEKTQMTEKWMNAQKQNESALSDMAYLTSCTKDENRCHHSSSLLSNLKG